MGCHRNMLVIELVPSGRVFMLALSRDPGTSAPDWARPIKGSLPTVPGPPCSKFDCWPFQAASVNPRLYDQSWKRLCMANRFATAASMSLSAPGVSRLLGWHSVLNHTLLHG